MGELTDAYILMKKGEARPVESGSQFSLADLVGKGIDEHRQIRNPREYDPETSSPNPEFFDVFIFSDETFLLTENRGDGECTTLHSFFYNGNRTLYSDSLFGC